MDPIRFISVTQVRVFKADELAISFSRSPHVLAKIQQDFGFAKAGQAEAPVSFDPNGGLVFNDGEHEYMGQRYLVQQLLIESRRIIINYAGPSIASSAFFSEIIERLKPFDQFAEGKDYKPLILTEETSSVQKLSFPFTSVFSTGPLQSFVSSLENHVDPAGCKVTALPSSIKFKISYSEGPEEVLKAGVQIMDKELLIEPRFQTPLDECVYFIKSPNSSDEHMKLIGLLEESVQKRQ
jgi:hypothetical protein